MPVYHSAFNENSEEKVCNAAVLPLKTKTNGLAPAAKPDEEDIIDEAIKLFRANVLYRNFEIKGPADLVLVYITVFIAQLIREVSRYKKKEEAVKHVYNLTRNDFIIPGEKGFTIAGYFNSPTSPKETNDFKSYFRQIREETGARLMEAIYREDGTQNKFWFQFGKNKFMNISSV